MAFIHFYFLIIPAFFSILFADVFSSPYGITLLILSLFGILFTAVQIFLNRPASRPYFLLFSPLIIAVIISSLLSKIINKFLFFLLVIFFFSGLIGFFRFLFIVIKYLARSFLNVGFFLNFKTKALNFKFKALKWSQTRSSSS